MGTSVKHPKINTRIAITPERLAVLRAHIDRSGKGPVAILAGMRDKPAGLTSNIVCGWASGHIRNARAGHWAYVLDLYLHTFERIPLTSEMRSEIDHHWVRVGLPIDEVFERLTTVPEGLTARVIRRWVSGEPPVRIRKDHFEYVLSAWRELPNRRQ